MYRWSHTLKWGHEVHPNIRPSRSWRWIRKVMNSLIPEWIAGERKWWNVRVEDLYTRNLSIESGIQWIYPRFETKDHLNTLFSRSSYSLHLWEWKALQIREIKWWVDFGRDVAAHHLCEWTGFLHLSISYKLYKCYSVSRVRFPRSIKSGRRRIPQIRSHSVRMVATIRLICPIISLYCIVMTATVLGESCSIVGNDTTCLILSLDARILLYMPRNI